ncbi:MAG: hypothetical protein Q9159_000073 [Coniocarpon cinnabarinum]
MWPFELALPPGSVDSGCPEDEDEDPVTLAGVAVFAADVIGPALEDVTDGLLVDGMLPPVLDWVKLDSELPPGPLFDDMAPLGLDWLSEDADGAVVGEIPPAGPDWLGPDPPALLLEEGLLLDPGWKPEDVADCPGIGVTPLSELDRLELVSEAPEALPLEETLPPELGWVPVDLLLGVGPDRIVSEADSEGLVADEILLPDPDGIVLEDAEDEAIVDVKLPLVADPDMVELEADAEGVLVGATPLPVLGNPVFEDVKTGLPVEDVSLALEPKPDVLLVADTLPSEFD